MGYSFQTAQPSALPYTYDEQGRDFRLTISNLAGQQVALAFILRYEPRHLTTRGGGILVSRNRHP